MSNSEVIRENIKRIRGQVEEAVAKSGRDSEEILLLAVTKTVSPEAIEIAIEEGIKAFGENRFQEASAKIPHIRSEAIWHMVGHLQSNKAKGAVELFHVIHSLDSLKLARKIDAHAREQGKIQSCLVEVNLSGEESKYGIPPEELKDLLENCSSLEHIAIDGLMTIPPYDPDPEKSRPAFQDLRKWAQDASGWNYKNATVKELSMGMTGDFIVAIEEGATIIRVGTGIFGERNY
jgi:pyridoxal phosphate enzyme (YggS family)